jgi:biopolymer transport protein ExbD
MGLSVGSGGQKGAVVPQMNVTPLVDVVLVLLIIFMVVTPLLAKHFFVSTPRPDAQGDPAPRTSVPFTLRVGAAGTLTLAGSEVARAELKRRVASEVAARPKDEALLFEAEDEAPYGLAVEALDLARQGGAANIAVLTKPTGSATPAPAPP